MDTIKDPDGPDDLIEGPGGLTDKLIEGRYKLEKLLGQGGGGKVYAARDLIHKGNIALKIIPNEGRPLGEEFLIARTLIHPNIVRVLDVGRVSEQLDYFTMDLIEGGDLRSIMEVYGAQGMLRAAVGCARALDYVHSRAQIHGDLKPSNILFVHTEHGVEVQVIDFGLSRAAKLTLCGTPAYMAPELVRGDKPSISTDLYALGVSLYEAITGRNPFLASTITETNERHRTLHPRRPEGVPLLFGSVVMRLMTKDPATRYQSASEFLHALSDVAPEASRLMGKQMAPMPVDSGPFVGRDEMLSELLEMLPPDQGGTVLIRGVRGVGRSRLVDELLVRVRLRGLRAIHIRCGDFSGEMAVLREIARVASMLAPEAFEEAKGELRQLMIAGVGEGGEEAEARVLSLVRRLAHVLGESPVVFVLDDVDQVAPDTRPALHRFIQSLCTRCPSLIVGTTRFFAPVPAELMGQGLRTRDLCLEALSLAEVEALLPALIGSQGERSALFAKVLYEASGGVPGHIQKMLVAFHEVGALTWLEGRWSLDPRLGHATAAQLREGVTFYEAPALDDASERELHLLQRAAIFGERFETRMLSELMGGVRTGELDDLCTQGWLVRGEVGGSGFYRFVSSELWRACRAQMALKVRKALHRQAAEIIIRERPQALEEIALQLFESGLKARSRATMERSVGQAIRSGQPAQAARLLRWLLGHAKPEEAAGFHVRIGDCELSAGELEASQRHIEAAVEIDGERVHLLRRLGWVHSEAGLYKEATPRLERALEMALVAGEDKELMECRFALGWTLMMSGDYEGASHCATEGLEQAAGRELSVVARLHRLEGTIGWHQGAALKACQAFERGAVVARRCGDQGAEADCQMGLGTGLRMRGKFAQSVREYRKAIRLNQRLGRLSRLAKCLNGLGIVHYITGDWGEAAVVWEQFRDTCVRTGDMPDLVMAHNNLGFLFKDRGELERAEAELVRGFGVATNAGFTRGLAMIQGNLGEVRTLQGQYREAREHLEDACSLALEIGSRDELVEGRRRLCELLLAEGDAKGAFEAADEVLAEAIERANKGEEGNLRRVRGESLLAQGKVNDALVELERARRVLEDAGGRLDLARCEMALVRALLEKSPEEVRNLAEKVREAASEVGALGLLNESEVLLDEISQREWESNHSLVHLLEVARDVSSVLDLDQLMEVIADRALEISGANRALLLVLDEGEEVKLHTARWRAKDLEDDQTMRISRTIADRVYREGRSVIVTDVMSDPELREAASIRNMRLRAIMCVPMMFHGQMVGILYVDSRQAATDFTNDDLKVLEALAGQAAVAIQNARMFELEKRRRELISHMAHDFRTPLTALQITLQMLINELPDLDEELLELLLATKKQVRGLDRMTSLVVNLEKLKQGRFPIRPVSLALASHLEVLFHSLSPLVREARLSLLWSLEGLPMAYADPDAVTRIITNLIGNAVKAVPPGGRINVKAHTTRGGPGRGMSTDSATAIGWAPNRSHGFDRWIQIDVQDNGPGMSAAQMLLLSDDPLGSRSEGPSASGFGLAIVRELVQRLGGRIWCESGLGEGTVISFTLPVSSQETPM